MELTDLIQIYLKEKVVFDNMNQNFDSQFEFAADFVLFSLMLNSPIMRTQNYVLRIFEGRKIAKEVNENGIHIDCEKGEVILYYDYYKSQKKHGFIQRCLPNELAKEIIKYYIYIHKKNSNSNIQYLFQSETKKDSEKIILKRLRRIAKNEKFSVQNFRYVVETKISESKIFTEEDEIRLSESMLHDHQIAKKHYKKRKMEEVSKEENDIYHRLIDHYSPKKIENEIINLEIIASFDYNNINDNNHINIDDY